MGTLQCRLQKCSLPHRWSCQFNIETPDNDAYKDQVRIYRSISSSQTPPPPFELQVLLAVPELSPNQALVYRTAPDSPRVRVEPTPKYILLESWQLVFAPQRGHASESDLAPSSIYKHGMVSSGWDVRVGETRRGGGELWPRSKPRRTRGVGSS